MVAGNGKAGQVTTHIRGSGERDDGLGRLVGLVGLVAGEHSLGHGLAWQTGHTTATILDEELDLGGALGVLGDLHADGLVVGQAGELEGMLVGQVERLTRQQEARALHQEAVTISEQRPL